jgi:hypothetical protein
MDIGMAADEDYGRMTAFACHLVMEVDPAGPGQPDIKDDASRGLGPMPITIGLH